MVISEQQQQNRLNICVKENEVEKMKRRGQVYKNLSAQLDKKFPGIWGWVRRAAANSQTSMPLKEGQFAVSKLHTAQQVKQEKAETGTAMPPEWFSAEILASERVGREVKEQNGGSHSPVPGKKCNDWILRENKTDQK